MLDDSASSCLCVLMLPEQVDKRDAKNTNFSGTYTKNGVTHVFDYIRFCSLFAERITEFLTGGCEELPDLNGGEFCPLQRDGKFNKTKCLTC